MKYHLTMISITIVFLILFFCLLEYRGNKIDSLYENVCVEFKPILIMKDGKEIETDKVVCTQRVTVLK